MIKKVEGIVISEVNYGETSKIINVLTKELGTIGIMAKGAKSLKSKLRSVTSKFTYGYFYIYYKEDKLSILKEVDIINYFKNIKKDLILLAYLNYLTQLTSQVMKNNQNVKVFIDYISSLKKIDKGLNPLVITNILEIKLLDYLGVGINLNSCVKCGDKNNILTINGDSGGYICQKCLTNEQIVNSKTIKMLRMYYLIDINSIKELKISDIVIKEINNFLDKYYDRYTGLYLMSKDFLKKLL